jgi:translocator protein
LKVSEIEPEGACMVSSSEMRSGVLWNFRRISRSVLYIFMGVSLYLIWIRGERARHWYALIVVFFIQLMLNGFWTPAFFGMESPLAGLTVIVPLWFMIVATIWLARNFSLPASLLLVPYLLWVSFAMVLNALIWYLN